MKNKSVIKLVVYFVALAALIFSSCRVYEKYYSVKVVKIGVIVPLTGTQANYGKYIRNGLNLALDEINKKSSEKQFKLVFEDDKADPKEGVNAINKLISMDGVKVIFGPWASSSALAVAPIAENNKVILMAEAISPKLKTSGDYIFRIQPDAKLYLDKLVSYTEKERPELKKVAILYINNDFGKDQADYMKDKLVRIGRVVCFNQSFEPKSTDFKTVILRIKETNPDAIFCPAYAELSNILVQLRENGLKCQVFGSVPTENPSIVKAAKGAADGVIYPYHFDATNQNPKFRQFMNNYHDKYGEYPEGFASLAYDGLNILCNAILDCNDYDTDKIKKRLYGTQHYNGINGDISFDKDGDVSMPIVIKKINGEKFNVIWK
jgi:branched-chain amino acid transport system substrate-binding protein